MQPASIAPHKLTKEHRHVERLIRDSLEKSFQQSCSKYDFVHQYWEILESLDNRNIIEFEYNSENAKEGEFGGVGDRLAGLVTAATMALRFKRMLIIKADNDFLKFFRPYSNPSSRNVIPEGISYQNATKLLNYSSTMKTWKLTHCMNPEYDPDVYFQQDRMHLCGLDNLEENDIKEYKVIRLRSNRCYLCKWMHNNTNTAHLQLRDVLKLKPSDNLYEVAGCMLRLAMWPTDVAVNMLADVITRQLHRMPPSKNLRTTINAVVNTTMLSDFSTVNQKLENSLFKGIAGRIVQQRNHRKEENNRLARPHTLPFIIGMHFRCGDSFIKSSKKSDLCAYNAASPSMNSQHIMRSGTPMGAGMCSYAASSSLWHYIRNTSVGTNNIFPDEISFLPSELLVHIASDNHRSSQQMHEFASNNQLDANVYPSPIGCHIDINSTSLCRQDTMVHFLLLSLSNILIVPLENGMPISGFSRFAAVYGLKTNDQDAILSPFDCSGVSTYEVSHVTHGNWICDELYDVMDLMVRRHHDLLQKQASKDYRALINAIVIFCVAVTIKCIVGTLLVEKFCPSLAVYRKYLFTVMVFVSAYLYFVF